MFSGICAALAKQAARRCHGDFLKEKGLITSLQKDATPKKFFFYTTSKTSSVFILIFNQKQRVDHNGFNTQKPFLLKFHLKANCWLFIGCHLMLIFTVLEIIKIKKNKYCHLLILECFNMYKNQKEPIVAAQNKQKDEKKLPVH